MNSKRTKTNTEKLMMSVSGVRGIVGKSFTPDIVLSLIASFSRVLGNKGTVVIGRDSRNTGPAISRLVSSAFNLCGMDVIDIGLAPTPTVQLIVEKKKAKGGIVVTASHNPIEWNALKFIKADGTFLSKNEIDKVFKYHHNNDYEFTTFKETGSFVEDYDCFRIHLDEIFQNIDTSAIKKSGFKVLIDSVGGAGSKITPLFLKELGCKVIEHNTEVTGQFPRGSEPTPGNLKVTAKKVQSTACDIGFCQDPDADRLAIIDETGKAIGEEMTLALATLQKLHKKKGAIVINLSTSRMVEDLALEYGVPFYRAEVGEINVVDKMKAVKAIFGGEGNGGVIDPAIHLGRDSLVGMAYILELMARQKKPLSKIVQQIPSYKIKKDTMPLGMDFAKVRKSLKAHYQKSKEKIVIDEKDGFRVDFSDQRCWMHIRPSNTEPIIRLIGEAPSEGQLRSMFQEFQNILGNIS